MAKRKQNGVAAIGHNSGVIAKDQVKSIIDRVENLEEQKKATTDEIREVYAEAKGNGFDTRALRKTIQIRKLDADVRREQEMILETYMNALGMLSDAPLGQAAIKNATNKGKVPIEKSMTAG